MMFDRVNSRLAVELAFAVALCFSGGVGCQGVQLAGDRGGETIRLESVMPVASQRRISDSQGLLLGVEFRGDGLDQLQDGCRLRLEHKETHQNTFILIRPSDRALYAPLEAGSYTVSRIGCGFGKIWNLKDLFTSAISIEKGKASYLGSIAFRFRSGHLDEVVKASRSENMKQLRENMLKFLPEGKRIVSAFNGREVVLQGLMQEEFAEGFDVVARGTKEPARILEPLLEDLKECGVQDAKTDPLRIGRLSFLAIYQKRKFLEWREQKSEGALGESFLDCVQAKHQKFEPETLDRLEVRTRY